MLRVVNTQQHPLPVVLKADGLLAGKGVVICENPIEAIAEFELMIQRPSLVMPEKSSGGAVPERNRNICICFDRWKNYDTS